MPVSAVAQMRPSRSLIGLPVWGILLILKKIHQSGQKPQGCHRFKKKKDDYNFAETGAGKVTP